MLAHRVGDLLLQVVVCGADFGTDNGGLVQVEQHVLVHHVLGPFRALELLEGLLLLVEQQHVGNFESSLRTASLMASKTEPSELLNSTVAQRPGFSTRNIS